MAVNIDRQEAQKQALESPNVQRNLDGHTIARVIYVPGKLVNIVTQR